MDIVVTLPTRRVWIDVFVINPLAPSYLRHKDQQRHPTRHMARKFRWEVVSQIGAALAHANYCMVEEAALKSEWPTARTRGLYALLWKRAPCGRAKSGDTKGRQVRRELFAGDYM